MTDSRTPERLPALLLMCALTIACLVIGAAGVAPARVSATALLGDLRSPGERAFIASHRGGAERAPENTLPAVRAALAAGYDWVEVDVALTADRHPILLHDATVDRTTNGTGAVAALTLAEVRSLDAGAWFSAAFAGTPVPTADEALDLLAAEGGRALIDMKGEWDAAAAASLADAITVRGLDDSVIVASFDARTLAAVAARSAVITRMVILRDIPGDVVAAATQAGARGVIVGRRALDERSGVVDELHGAGLRVIVYTLNSDRHWESATDLGVDGIVTDDPGLLREWQGALADG